MSGIEINVGKYTFYEFYEREHYISFNVKGRFGYSITEKDNEKMDVFFSYMGKWEEMLIPLIGVINDLGISSIDSPVEEFVSDNYEYGYDFNKSFRGETHLIYTIFPRNLSTKISMETFLIHLKNAKKWKLLVDTILSLYPVTV